MSRSLATNSASFRNKANLLSKSDTSFFNCISRWIASLWMDAIDDLVVEIVVRKLSCAPSI